MGVVGGMAYGAIVFAVGFAAGALRLLLLAPRVGAVAAVAIETPFMLIAAWFVSSWTAQRFRVPATLDARITMGFVGFALLQGLELALAMLAFQRTAVNYIDGLLQPPALIGVVAQVVIAVFPVLQRSAHAGRNPE